MYLFIFNHLFSWRHIQKFTVNALFLQSLSDYGRSLRLSQKTSNMPPLIVMPDCKDIKSCSSRTGSFPRCIMGSLSMQNNCVQEEETGWLVVGKGAGYQFPSLVS